MKPSRWDEATSGPISVEAIRMLHQPESNYRVSWNKYPPSTEFPGESFLSKTLYVLRGSCSVGFGDWSCRVGAGEFIELPGGKYRFSVRSDEEVEIVSVWELPAPLRRKYE